MVARSVSTRLASAALEVVVEEADEVEGMEAAVGDTAAEDMEVAVEDTAEAEVVIVEEVDMEVVMVATVVMEVAAVVDTPAVVVAMEATKAAANAAGTRMTIDGRVRISSLRHPMRVTRAILEDKKSFTLVFL